ncbi:MAG: hypothetical protein KC933_35125, partial [Myxococcales bacterium]|nr:hypothetical protein [Myxococcales bacterium]
MRWAKGAPRRNLRRWGGFTTAVRLPLLLLPLTLTLACGGSAPPGTLLAGEPDSGVPTTGTSTTADAAVEPDAAPVDANEPDAGATDAGLEEECAELGLCCPELEGLAAEACLRAVEGNDPAQCQQALNLAAQAGVCGLDAGPRDGGWPRP